MFISNYYILFAVVPSSPQTAELKAKKGTSSWIEISSESEEE